MTPEVKWALWFFSRAAALILPMVAVPILTLTLLPGGYTATLVPGTARARGSQIRLASQTTSLPGPVTS